jgi:hypothetical protein
MTQSFSSSDHCRRRSIVAVTSRVMSEAVLTQVRKDTMLHATAPDSFPGRRRNSKLALTWREVATVLRILKHTDILTG